MNGCFEGMYRKLKEDAQEILKLPCMLKVLASISSNAQVVGENSYRAAIWLEKKGYACLSSGLSNINITEYGVMVLDMAKSFSNPLGMYKNRVLV